MTTTKNGRCSRCDNVISESEVLMELLAQTIGEEQAEVWQETCREDGMTLADQFRHWLREGGCIWPTDQEG